jgi:hypothetical protein
MVRRWIENTAESRAPIPSRDSGGVVGARDLFVLMRSGASGAGNMASIILLPTSWNAAAVLSLLSPTTKITRMGTLDGSSVQMSWLNSLH